LSTGPPPRRRMPTAASSDAPPPGGACTPPEPMAGAASTPLSSSLSQQLVGMLEPVSRATSARAVDPELMESPAASLGGPAGGLASRASSVAADRARRRGGASALSLTSAAWAPADAVPHEDEVFRLRRLTPRTLFGDSAEPEATESSAEPAPSTAPVSSSVAELAAACHQLKRCGGSEGSRCCARVDGPLSPAAAAEKGPRGGAEAARVGDASCLSRRLVTRP